MTSTLVAPSAADVSSNETPIYVLFDSIVLDGPDALTRDHLVGVANGTIGAITVRNFGTPDESAAVMAGLDAVPMGSYDEKIVYPRVPKLGPAAYDFYDAHSLNDAYWTAAAEAAPLRATLLDGTDPLDRALERITQAWQGETAPAHAGGRAMFAGMVRETTAGMKMHWDEIGREMPGTLDEPVIAQIAFNWYLSMPAAGGQTQVYRRRWRPSDEQARDGYGYDERIAAEEPVAVVTPQAGDAIFFDPRNFHAVRGNEGPGRRVSLSFFLGVASRGPLQYWS